MQNNIDLKKLIYKARRRKNYSFSKILLFIIFSRNIHTRVLSIEDADKEKGRLLNHFEQAKYNQIENQAIHPMNDLGNAVIRKENSNTWKSW